MKRKRIGGGKRRKSLWERAPMLCMALAAFLVIGVITGVFFIRKYFEHKEILAHEGVFYEGIYVENIPLGGLTMEDIVSVGIGSPGVIDPKNGIVEYWSNLDFHHVPLAEMLNSLAGRFALCDPLSLDLVPADSMLREFLG